MNAKRRTWVLALSSIAVATLIAESAVRADDGLCPAGKIAGPQTAGHCCWPGQSWDSQSSFCAGKPECPAGATRDGLTCVGTPTAAPVAEGGAPASPSSSALAPLAADAGAQIASPTANAMDAGVAPASADAGAPAAATASAISPPPPPPPPDTSPPTTASGKKLGGGLLTIGGFLIMGAGYALSIGTAFIPIGYDGKPFGVCSEGWFYNLVPLIGPVLRTSNYPPAYVYSPGGAGSAGPPIGGGLVTGGSQVTSCTTQRDLVTVLSVTSEVAQIVGLGAAASGVFLLGKSSADPKSASLRLMPFAPGSQAGASLMVVGF